MQKPTRTLSIGELSARVGLRPSALRYYEAEGLLPLAPRQGGKRRYDEGMVRRLVLIRTAQNAGFTIAEIKKLLAGAANGAALARGWRELAERKLPEIEAQVQRAREMQRWLREGLACDCISIETCRLVR
jgi:MerR family transcriptional regulator, redox-sensitive transcriptional activator SoxR